MAYTVMAVLGRGGCGRAFDRNIIRVVAVGLLPKSEAGKQKNGRENTG